MLTLVLLALTTTVRVDADRHWGIVTLDGYIEDVGSANNSVIRFADGTWSGGAPFHGNWTLDRATIFVDGLPIPLCQDSLTLSRAMIAQTSTLYDAVRLTSTTFIGEGIDEHFVFDGLEEKPIATFYPALGSRANRLTDWAAFDAAGLLLGSGSTSSDNNANTYLPKGTMRVAQFDPVLGDGLLTTWAFEGSATVFIVDRPYDNKLYLSMGVAADHFEISQSLRMFEGSIPVPEPSAFWLAALGLVALARRLVT